MDISTALKVMSQLDKQRQYAFQSQHLIFTRRVGFMSMHLVLGPAPSNNWRQTQTMDSWDPLPTRTPTYASFARERWYHFLIATWPCCSAAQLTPRKTFLTLYDTMDTHGDLVNCCQLLDWITLALVRTATSQPPNLQQDQITAPIADEYLVRHRNGILIKHLPSLAQPTAASHTTQELVNSVGQVVAEQRLPRLEAHRVHPFQGQG
mmetsp:Transcript_27616/g.39019  ORF Transcript_27616/g.39019 Transcript_27616/m.39019 type:complete len:207 (-) Transcript_27616:297-917(-)